MHTQKRKLKANWDPGIGLGPNFAGLFFVEEGLSMVWVMFIMFILIHAF